jgi:hypothetical protein
MDSKNQSVKLRQDWQQLHIKSATFVTCANCISYDRRKDACLLFNSRPPVDVVVIGCDSWEQDIPF